MHFSEEESQAKAKVFTVIFKNTVVCFHALFYLNTQQQTGYFVLLYVVLSAMMIYDITYDFQVQSVNVI